MIIDGKKGQNEDDDEDDTFIVEEDPALQNILEVVGLIWCLTSRICSRKSNTHSRIDYAFLSLRKL